MWFIVWKAWDLSTNERIISFYKKELWSSHVLDKAKKLFFYWTKHYRKTIKHNFPSDRRYKRIKSLVSNAYRKNKEKYTMLSRLWKKI